MKSIFRLLSLAIILLIVALASAVTTIGLAVHGREVNVPKLLGLTPAEADRAAVASGLTFEVERRFYSADVAAGQVMSQVPQPGTMVRRGWQVRGAVSLGPQRVAIPDVMGQSAHAAEITIRQRGLELGGQAVAHIPETPTDVVVAQSPPANASGVAAPKISILLAAPAEEPAYVMPDFVGQPLSAVTPDIQAAGLRVGTVTVRSTATAGYVDQSPQAVPGPPTTTAPPASSPGASIILSQTPAAGQKVTAGSVVNFEVVR